MPFINRITVRLSQIALATTILTACTAAVSPAFGQTSQSDNPDWPLVPRRSIGPPDTHRQTRTSSPITSC